MCGIVGIYHKDNDVAGDIYDALIQVQHRGQDAAGIATWDGTKMSLHKDLGVVTEVFKTNEYGVPQKRRRVIFIGSNIAEVEKYLIKYILIFFKDSN